MSVIKKAAALGVTALGAVAAKNFYENQFQAMKMVRRLDENIYMMDYTLDYALDELLAKGVSNVPQMLSFVAGKTTFGINLFKTGKGGFACSTFNAFNEKGEHILARNFDYKKAPCMVVWTHPEKGYASVGVADCNFMLYGDFNKPVKTFNRLQTLLACMDGVNEKGLSIAILELKTKATHQNTGKKPISTTVAIRGVLDKCSTINEAVEFLQSYDMHDAFFCCYHYQITDASGDSVIVEYVNGEMRLFRPEKKDGIRPVQHLENFFLSEDGDNSKGFGYDRAEKIEEKLSKSGGNLNELEAMELLDEVHLNYKHEKYPWYVTTLWSVVYNSNALTATVAAGMNYEKIYRFSISEPLISLEVRKENF
ncbi:MAG: C45 family peptidase [Clostridia bacterium]|nr:C45 family peptidase [Clostridia bacterium]